MQSIKVQVPFSLNASTARAFLGKIVGADREPLGRRISICFARVDWIDTAGVTILSNVIEWLQHRDVTFGFENCDANRQAIRYLDDCGFFQAHVGKPLRPHAQLRSTTFPVKTLTRSEGYSWVTNEMIPWVSSRLQKDPRALVSLSVSVRELLNNVSDHSEEDIGCIHVQHFPKQGTIVIAVSDMGIGIPVAMRRAFSIGNDSQAILRATERGVTSKTGVRNQGVGLDVLLSDVVAKHGGKVNISSNRGFLECFNQSGSICRLAQPERQMYPGTIFEIVVPAAALRVEAEDEDLSW